MCSFFLWWAQGTQCTPSKWSPFTPALQLQTRSMNCLFYYYTTTWKQYIYDAFIFLCKLVHQFLGSFLWMNLDTLPITGNPFLSRTLHQQKSVWMTMMTVNLDVLSTFVVYCCIFCQINSLRQWLVCFFFFFFCLIYQKQIILKLRKYMLVCLPFSWCLRIFKTCKGIGQHFYWSVYILCFE